MGRREPGQREQDLILLAKLLCQGKTQFEMSARIGVSRQQIAVDLRKLHARWRESQLESLGYYMNRELEKLSIMEEACWEAWERSVGVGTAEKLKGAVLQDSVPDDDPGDPNVSRAVVRVLREFETTQKPTAGDPRWIIALLQIMDRRIKILGLDQGGPKTAFPGMDDKEQDDPRAALRAKLLSQRARIEQAQDIPTSGTSGGSDGLTDG